ncbi:MAG: ASCH domain-containing protein [Rhizobiaceae bacterium]|nr:ASCH domain-containing protein [Rhizobiaceae bacterium]
MVAYFFAPQFRGQVAALTKLQTVRADRRRHARPGEAVQLYAGMRTKHCVKLVDPDPICVSVHSIEISTTPLLDEFIAAISIDGVPLDRDGIEAFARADGFAPEHFGEHRFPAKGDGALVPATARYWMGWWWMRTHNAGRFEGVLIKWRPA